MAKLNERIKARRIELGYTLLYVAEKINIKEATMQRYESGVIKNIKHETIVELASVLKCNPSYLMGWTDNPAITEDNNYKLSHEEKMIIADYRKLSKQGREYIRQQMFMAKEIYKKSTDIPDMEVLKEA